MAYFGRTPKKPGQRGLSTPGRTQGGFGEKPSGVRLVTLIGAVQRAAGQVRPSRVGRANRAVRAARAGRSAR